MTGRSPYFFKASTTIVVLKICSTQVYSDLNKFIFLMNEPTKNPADDKADGSHWVRFKNPLNPGNLTLPSDDTNSIRIHDFR